MRLLGRILLGLLAFLLLGTVAIWGLLHTEFFWRAVGGKLVSLAREECHCAVSVGSISGNPFDGLFFNDVVIATSEEEVIHARSLEIKLSFWSVFILEPRITRVAITEPHLNIKQDSDGEWNIIKVLPPPPQQLRHFFKVVFSKILIVNGDGKVSQGGQILNFDDLNLETDLEVRDPITPQQTLKVGEAVATANTLLGRVGLVSSFIYGKDYIDLRLLEVKRGKKTLLSLAGEADLRKGGRIQAIGELDLPPQEIHQVWERWPLAWGANVNFRVTGNMSQFQVNLTGKVQEVTFDVAGTLGSQAETWNYDLQGQVNNLNSDIVTIFDKSLVKKLNPISHLEVKFHLQGTDFTLPPAKFSWNLEVEPFKYSSVKVDKVKIALTGDRDNQQIKVTVDSASGHLAVNAAGPLFLSKEGKLSVQVDSFRPGGLGLAVPEGTMIAGKFDGRFSLPEVTNLNSLKVSGELAGSGTIGQHPLNDVHACLAWAKDRLEISQADAQVGNLAVALHGTLLGDKLNFSFQGKSGNGGNWPIPAAVGGQFSGEGTLTGSLSDPQVALKARGQGLAYEKYSLQTVSVTAQTSGWPLAKGRIEVQAAGVKTPAGVFSQANLRSEGSGKLWNFDLKATGPENAKIDVHGAADLGRSSVSVSQAQVHTKNLTVKNLGPIEISLSSGIEIKPATLEVNKGRVGLQARITEQQATGSLTLQNLPAELVSPPSLSLKGTISGQATLSGTARQPVIQGNISLGAGSYQDFQVQSIHSSFSYQDNRLTLNGSLATKEKGLGLTWSGQVPLRLSLMPFALGPGQGEIRVLVQGQNVNLSLLPAFVKAVESAQGAINVQARIEGTISQPKISGQVSWSEGSIKLGATGATYQLQPGEIRLQGNHLTIPQLTLRSEGTATLTGEITLSGFRPDEVRARLQMDNFKAIDKLGSEAFVNGSVNLDGRYPNLAVRGSLSIPKAHFRLAFLNLGLNAVNKDVILVREQKSEAAKAPAAQKTRQGKEPEVWKDVRVDLTIQAPNNVWVDDRQAKIEAAVNIEVKKQPGRELAYSGQINTLHGHVFIVGRQFQVTRGIVTLPAGPGAEPLVDARLEYEATEVKLYVNASGPVSNPKITLGGEPGISESDWMAYLLYGKPVGALSREEQSAAMAAGAFGGLATQMILRDLLGMAPPLTKGLSITYQHRNDPLYRDDPYQVVINYRINRHFSVESQVGGRNTGGDVLFNYDF